MYPRGIKPSIIRLFFLLSWLSLGLGQPLLAQKSKEQLESEKYSYQKQLSQAQEILKETEKKRSASLGQLRAINRQIEIRQKLIRSITLEMNLFSEEISELGTVVASLENDLTVLKKEYATMLYAFQKMNANQGALSFLFSAATFNQFAMRFKYLNQYSEVRQNQVDVIQKVLGDLAGKKNSLEEKRKEKQKLLKQEITQNKSLMALKKKQKSLLAKLSTKEKELKRTVANNKKAVDRLDKLIEDTPELAIATTPSVRAVTSGSFEKSKSKLPWPVSNGFISNKFGRQEHPVLKNVYIENKGIGIQTGKDESVKAVFDGQVVMVAAIPGMGNAVIMQHGNYRTVYAKLGSIQVKKGQMVKANTPIGSVSTLSDGTSELLFQVWKDKSIQDPQQWLAKR